MHRHLGNAATALPAALVAAASLALGGCFQSVGVTDDPSAGAAIPPVRTTPVPDPVRAQIVFTALQMVGTPYKFGGSTPAGFDCSGLVQYTYRNAGLSVPRTSREQLTTSSPVELAAAAPGDLLFFRSKDFSHVGIYLGDGRFIHAPSTGRSVEITSFGENSYYRDNFVRAGRMQGVTAAATCSAGADGNC